MAKNASPKCWKTNPADCAVHGASARAAYARRDLNAYIDAKEAEAKATTEDTEKFFGVSEGALIRNASAGIDGTSSNVEYDSFNHYMKHYGYKVIPSARPKNDIEAAIFDKAKEALGSGTNVIVRNVYISKGSFEGDSSGKITFGTAQTKEVGLLDGVQYSYTKTNGNITFYKKTMLGKKDLTNELIQEDIMSARKHYHRFQQGLSASSG